MFDVDQRDGQQPGVALQYEKALSEIFKFDGRIAVGWFVIDASLFERRVGRKEGVSVGGWDFLRCWRLGLVVIHRAMSDIVPAWGEGSCAAQDCLVLHEKGCGSEYTEK